MMKSKFLGFVAGKRLGFLLICTGVLLARAAGLPFVNFETAPVHPIALSPDGHTLAVCNLPDGRVEFFDVAGGIPVASGSVPVGIDPVSLRFRGTNELWVVNFISSSVSVIDVAAKHVVATLGTFTGPSDVVFAGTPERGYVSCSRSNVVMVFDPVTRAVVTNINIDGEMPRALAVSPDGAKVYVAIFESGNRSTIAALAVPQITAPSPDPGDPPQFTMSLLEVPSGPYGGAVPPPNVGTNLVPALYREPFVEFNAPEFYERTLPDSIIVKKDAAGRWMDDNNGDWTEFISGTNAAATGRIPGWDMPDRDLAIIDTTTDGVTYATGLMNICMNLAVNPVSGTVAVIGTDATNERRFEPNVRGTFVRVNLAMVNPLTLSRTVVDLNPHLYYSTSSVPQSVRDPSLGDPRGIVWNSAGTRGYVTGMGSRNMIVIDEDGHRVQSAPVELGEGPTGLALDEPRQRLYVWNRFSSTLSVLDTITLNLVSNVALFDPTPPAIKVGRKHLYDTRRNSGLGQAACGSCHVDARFDRLAWDLSDPSAAAFIPGSGVATEFFHPLKGPLVTQTLQDIIGLPPAALHWRGDRASIEKFDLTFRDLLGADSVLATNDMQEFKAFLETIAFPPNRFRNFDNSTPTNVPLPGFFGINPLTGLVDRTALPAGNAARGNSLANCTACHARGSGFGTFMDELNAGRGKLEIHKAAQLRSVADKLGFDLSSTNSRAGFGLQFDGRADTFTRFLVSVFNFTNNQDIADTTAFVLASFPGELPAAVGRQVTLGGSASNALALAMIALATTGTTSVEIIAHGQKDGLKRAWFFDRFLGRFASDRNNEDILPGALLALTGPGQELTMTVVAAGTGRRLSIDRDGDGTFDRTELDTGFDPNDPLSNGGNRPPYFTELSPRFEVHPGMTVSIPFAAIDSNAPPQTLRYALTLDSPAGSTLDATNGLFHWVPTPEQSDQTYHIGVEVADDGVPVMRARTLVDVNVVTLRATSITPNAPLNSVFIDFRTIAGQRYQLQFKNNLGDPAWTDGPIRNADGPASFFPDSPYPKTNTQQRFYRIIRLEQ